jgi:hypothetical protein
MQGPRRGPPEFSQRPGDAVGSTVSDGTLINRRVLEEGYGRVYEHFPFAEAGAFRQAQLVAKANGRGSWAKPTPELARLPAIDDSSTRAELAMSARSASSGTPRTTQRASIAPVYVPPYTPS